MLAVQSQPSTSALSSFPAVPPAESAPPTQVAEALPDTVPENAPAHCPGTDSTEAGKASACEGCPNQSTCATTPKGPDPDLPKIKERMKGIRNKILVMSGKGGVGKSTFTSMLGWAFSGDEKIQVSGRASYTGLRKGN